MKKFVDWLCMVMVEIRFIMLLFGSALVLGILASVWPRFTGPGICTALVGIGLMQVNGGMFLSSLVQNGLKIQQGVAAQGNQPRNAVAPRPN